MLTAIKNQIASALEHIAAGLHQRAAQILRDLHADILAAEKRVKEGEPAVPVPTAAAAENGTTEQKAP